MQSFADRIHWHSCWAVPVTFVLRLLILIPLFFRGAAELLFKNHLTSILGKKSPDASSDRRASGSRQKEAPDESGASKIRISKYAT